MRSTVSGASFAFSFVIDCPLAFRGGLALELDYPSVGLSFFFVGSFFGDILSCSFQKRKKFLGVRIK